MEREKWNNNASQENYYGKRVIGTKISKSRKKATQKAKNVL